MLIFGFALALAQQKIRIHGPNMKIFVLLLVQSYLQDRIRKNRGQKKNFRRPLKSLNFLTDSLLICLKVFILKISSQSITCNPSYWHPFLLGI